MTEKAEEGRHILAELQQSIVVCLQKGPEAFPEGVFAQKRERALLGLRTHANTIAYGRVKAVEDTYPLLLKAIGREAFHPLAQDYVERPDMLHANMNNIGNGFPFYLAQHLARWRAASRSADISAGEEASDRLDINDKRPNAPARAGEGSIQDDTASHDICSHNIYHALLDNSLIDLALIEREWLAVYRSKDGTALSSADLATLNGEALLNFPIATHPASRLIVLSGPLSPHLGVDMKDDMKGKSETERAERVEGITETVRVEGKEGEEGKGIINPYALWIVRPEAEIGFHILDKLSTRLLIALMPAGNMFQHVPDMPVNMVSNALSAISGADPQNISHPDALLAASVIDKGGSVNNRQKGPILTMGGLISYALDEEDETGALARIIDLIDRGGLIKEM